MVGSSVQAGTLATSVVRAWRPELMCGAVPHVDELVLLVEPGARAVDTALVASALEGWRGHSRRLAAFDEVVVTDSIH